MIDATCKIAGIDSSKLNPSLSVEHRKHQACFSISIHFSTAWWLHCSQSWQHQQPTSKQSTSCRDLIYVVTSAHPQWSQHPEQWSKSVLILNDKRHLQLSTMLQTLGDLQEKLEAVPKQWVLNSQVCICLHGVLVGRRPKLMAPKRRRRPPTPKAKADAAREIPGTGAGQSNSPQIHHRFTCFFRPSDRWWRHTKENHGTLQRHRRHRCPRCTGLLTFST